MVGASSSGFRSASCFCPASVAMGIWSAPELSITSGGLPPANRGCSVVPILTVEVILATSAPAQALYSLMCSAPYWSP